MGLVHEEHGQQELPNIWHEEFWLNGNFSLWCASLKDMQFTIVMAER